MFPTRQEGVVRFDVGIRVCDASTPTPHPVSRQSSSPADPAKYPARAACHWILPSILYPARAARQWIPPSIPPERLSSGSRRVSRQSSWPVDPAMYPVRAARQWIPPSIPPERLSSGSRRVSHQSRPPAEHPTRAARQWIAPSIPVSQSSWPVGPYPTRVARQWIPSSIPPSLVLLNVPPGAQLGLHFMLVPSCFECTLRLGKGDAFVLLWAVNKQLRLIPRRVSFWKRLGFCQRNRCLSSRDRLADKWSFTHRQVDKARHSCAAKYHWEGADGVVSRMRRNLL